MCENNYEPYYIRQVSLNLSCSIAGNSLFKQKRTGLISKKTGHTALD